MADNIKNRADYIVPLPINGLEGRMLRLPAKPGVKSREILFIYGHHSTIERWWGLSEVLTEYGTVTMPDLPGFGGMDSFYKIGQKPSIDAEADYLAAFIKWRFKRKKFVLAGMSFGFVVATRMLQKYPELTSKVELFVSIVGFTHFHDFTFTKQRLLAYRAGTKLLCFTPIGFIFRHTVLTAPVLRLAYSKTYSAKRKFAQADDKESFDSMMQTEIELWHRNDTRSHWITAREFLYLDITKERVDLPVWHVSTENDHFFNHTVVEQHLRAIFNGFYNAPTVMPNHAPSVIADAEAAAPLIPKSLRRVLSRLP